MGRTEEFVGGGKRRTVSRAEMAAAWAPFAEAGLPFVYAYGTGKHESAFTVNELDTEESGFKTYGIFQLSASELAAAGSSAAKVLAYTDDEKIPVLVESSRVLAFHTAKRESQILKATGLTLDEAMPDLLAYLAIGHNQGMGRYATAAERKPGEKPGALGSIADYGLDWTDYKKRNPGIKGIASYGDDVGGAFLDADKKKVSKSGRSWSSAASSPPASCGTSSMRKARVAA